MAVKTKKSPKFPHVEWIDLHDDGVLFECAVVKRDVRGNIYFIRLDRLDSIDLSRMFNIINNRNAKSYELWDLMSQVTLGNGINALVYFHQLVEMITPSGQIMKPKLGMTGGAMFVEAPAATTVAE